jgi:hypothetical protein
MCGDDKIRIVLPRPVTLVIGYREAETLVLEIADHVLRAVEEVSESFLEVCMARDFISVAALSVGNDPCPLKAAEVRRVEPLRGASAMAGATAIVTASVISSWTAKMSVRPWS